jgi:hypothetical protein
MPCISLDFWNVTYYEAYYVTYYVTYYEAYYED